MQGISLIENEDSFFVLDKDWITVFVKTEKGFVSKGAKSDVTSGVAFANILRRELLQDMECSKQGA